MKSEAQDKEKSLANSTSDEEESEEPFATMDSKVEEQKESPSTVKFNIGGKHYEVSKSLLNGFPDTMLAKRASSSSRVFIDRDPDRFSFCLDYMRDDGKVYLPETESKLAILEDLKFFGFEDIDETKIVIDEKSQQNCMARSNQITEATRKRIAQMEEEVGDLERDFKRKKGELELEKLALRCRAKSVESTGDSFTVDYSDVKELSSVHNDEYFIECCHKLALRVNGPGITPEKLLISEGLWVVSSEVCLSRKTN